jgi:competence protein ComEC
MSLTTPLSAYYFGAVSLVGIVTNLLCLWAVSLVFYGLILICVVYPVSASLSAAVGWGITWLIRYILSVCAVLADLPLAAVYTKSVYIVAWLIFVYLLLALFLYGAERKPLLLICFGTVGLCCALLASWAEPMSGECRVTVLDVGQGQSILLQTDGRTFLIDCGGDSDTETADIVAETLLSQGITCLDAIIVTHEDRDHAGALENLLSRIDTDAVFLPGTIETDGERHAGVKRVLVYQDMELSWGNGKLTVFAPIFAKDNNENSLCVLFTGENCAILVTGDRSEFGEGMLLRDAQLPKVDLLIAGHHGSKHSTGEDLLNAVRPDTVIISVGEDNPYGHPAPELLERLKRFGCQVYRTDQYGTIVFRR